MRAIDWLFVLGIIALIGGPLLTLRLIARQDAARRKGRRPPPARPYDDHED